MLPGRMLKRTNAILVAAVLLPVSSLGAGCDGNSRFPICKTDADCVAEEGKPLVGSICYDLRCVECANDTQCKVGEVCSLQSKECQSLGGGAKPDDEPPPKEESSGWEASSWKECAKDCKDKACIDECGKKFKDEDPGQ
jgi:hypothetical protein